MNNQPVILKWEVNETFEGQLLRTYLRDVQRISKKALAEIKFGGGQILVNGKEVTVRTVLKAYDQVIIMLPPELPSKSIVAEDVPLSIVYEDKHLLLINKPAGMPTIPSREHLGGTLANAIIGYYQRIGIASTFHAVNRLDKDTSGLLVIAKHRLAHDRLSKLQQIGKLKRFYVAMVQGRLADLSATIDAPIGRKLESIIEREVRLDGKRAITHYRVLELTEDYSLVRVQLETGRTHQIRVHFAYLGHPLCGDELYGGNRSLIGRHALHCSQLDFIHPFTEKVLSFHVPLPKDMEDITKAIRG